MPAHQWSFLGKADGRGLGKTGTGHFSLRLGDAGDGDAGDGDAGDPQGSLVHRTIRPLLLANGIDSVLEVIGAGEVSRRPWSHESDSGSGGGRELHWLSSTPW
ncbi:hypothetical protein N8467_00125 [bacterium]|nr:hypothetical protein [bacterium]